MRAFIASPLGFLIGLSLGALGGGGSVLAVPALVYVAGQDPRAATSTSLALVALTALVGIVPHARAGRVRFGKGSLFAVTGVAGTVVGTRLNAAVDPDVLLVLFAGLMLVVAILMLRSVRQQPAVRPVGAAVAPVPIGERTIALVPPVATGGGGALPTIVRAVATGTVVGALTGFFGVGGGFVIVPALVLALRFAMPEAVGTSMLVIVLNSVVALAARGVDGGIEPRVIIPFALASISGVIVGSRLADQRDPRSLQRWFAGLLVAVALYTALDTALGA